MGTSPAKTLIAYYWVITLEWNGGAIPKVPHTIAALERIYDLHQMSFQIYNPYFNQH